MALLPGEVAPDGIYNLWRGWGVEPVAGKHGKMLEFIHKVICDNDDVSYNYLIGWFARAVQQPGLQAEAAVVLKGARGTGKGTLGRAFIRLFGAHGKHLLHSRHLKGNFNAHLRTALGVFADEAIFVGDKEGNEVLKGLITEPTFMVEPKGIDAFEVCNRLKILISTNAEWAIPAAADERRYFILEVPETVKQNTEYFKRLPSNLYEQGGLAAWMDYLLKYDISDFNIRQVPTTTALVREKIKSLGRLDAWVYDKLYRGIWSEHSEEWETLVPNDNIIREYSEHCRQKQDKHEHTSGESIGKRLGKLFPTSGVRRLTLGNRPRQYYRTFPPLDRAREMFEQNALGGSPGNWPVAFDDDDDSEPVEVK